MSAAVLRPFRLALLAASAVPALALLAACSNGGTAAPRKTVTVTPPASTAPVVSSPSSAPAGARPGIVAVTTAGALVKLDPNSGAIIATLVPGGVLGDEISVSADGSTVYFSAGKGCHPQVESVSSNGGSPVAIAPGELPAISPDGTKLAYADQPLLKTGCIPSQANFAGDFKLIVRTLSSGTQKVLPLPPQVANGGLPSPISHLSWASDSTTLAVSTSAVQDNEGWGLYLVNTSVARYYVIPGPGVAAVPVTGADAQRSYIREGVYLPDGNLFISRACCGGFPVHNTSRLMWEVSSTGALVHQVAIGFVNKQHVSLAADGSGHWLLYLADHDLYVSQDGNIPSRLATGLIAATWM
ncbi:MAG TPA: hypothetical protein VF162_07575 [Streptosporangiaceae bacterium]